MDVKNKPAQQPRDTVTIRQQPVNQAPSVRELAETAPTKELVKAEEVAPEKSHAPDEGRRRVAHGKKDSTRGVMGVRMAGNKPAPDTGVEAIRRGDVAALQAFIKAGGDVNGHDGRGMTPLLLASVRGDVASMQLLLDAGAGLDVAHGRSGALPLHLAASGGNVDAVKLLLGRGASLEATWPINGHSPLVEAIFKNNAAAALALLDAGADPTRVTIRNVGTMDLALRNTTLNAAVIERLDAAFVAKGHPERRDAQGNPVVVNGRPLHDLDAAGKRSNMLQIFAQVAEADAAITPTPRTDADFVSALTLARSGDVEGLRALLDRDPTIVQARGGDAAENLVSTPLIFAAIAGRTEVVRLLLERGADANLAEVHPMAVTALFKAAVFGHTEIARLLVERGARIDDQGVANGMTPLHDAVLQGRAEIVRVLLQAGARIDIDDYTGATAVQFAAQRGSDEVKQAFRELRPTELAAAEQSAAR
ncbi:MAG: ankyrin repeat domain-containing protein [Deltaproteobacteria bacterium]|nr:ankyrin repeat domain-containing protein [Deltaproteobacteria bacterium]